MSKNKKSSIWLEPYNLLLIVWQGAALLVSSLTQAAKDVRHEAAQPESSNTQSKAAYTAISAEFDTPEFQKNWRTFLLRALCVQGILLALTIAHAVFGNLWLSLQLFVVFVSSIVLFGYRPWIRRNQNAVSFMTYLRKGLWKDPKSVLLYISLKQEHQCHR